MFPSFRATLAYLRPWLSPSLAQRSATSCVATVSSADVVDALACLAIACLGGHHAQELPCVTMFAYVGAITNDPEVGDAGPGICVLDVQPESGELHRIQTVSGLQSPTYLAIHPHLPVLYAGERNFPPMGAQSPGTGAVTTLSIDPATGQLTLLTRQESGGPTHLNVHPGGRYVVAAMNRVRQVGIFPVEGDGRVGAPSSVVEHVGRGPKSPNQDRAFPHSCWFDRAATRVLCCDLALDRVMLYDLDLATGTLRPAPQSYAQVSSGAGPRHLAIHPNNHSIYVLNELDSTISVFGYQAESGTLSILQTISTLPPEFTGQSAAAQILVDPAGRYVYASNRGHDSIVVFAIDPGTGKLRHVADEPCGGERPHNFTMDPSGSLMLVANQRSGSVVSFHIDADTGRLAATGLSVDVPSPVCVVVPPSRAGSD
jgi:6-phosphogluconolactonase